MLNKEIIKRRDRVQELILQGYTQRKIADILDVHYQTIHKDVESLNKRYSKYMAKHPEYLKNKLDKILKFVDELNYLKTEYHKLKEKASDEITVVTKKGNEIQIPRGSLDDERKMLDSIVKLISEQAKILQITSGKEEKYLQQNFIHIDQLNAKIVPLVEYFVGIIYKYVSKEQQDNALIELKAYDKDDKK